jgi:two-component system cell cycle sensor histidine kinase/response regulator CckA
MEKLASAGAAAQDGAIFRFAYNAESRVRVRRGASAYCAIAAALALTTIPLDTLRFADPGVVSALLWIRLKGAFGLAAVLALLQTPFGRRHPHAAGVLAPGVGGALVYGLVSVTGGDASPLGATVYFVMLGAALIIPWSAGWSTLACLLVVVGYLGAMFGMGPHSGLAVRETLLVLAAASVLTVGLTAWLERRRRAEFTQGWHLAAAHRESRASAERYRAVVDTAGSAIIILSSAGRLVELNREAERLLGCGRDEAVGQDYLTLCVAAESRDGMADDIGRALAGEATNGREARLLHRDGSERVVVYNVSQLGRGDGEGSVIVSAQDITERTRVEEALRDSEARLRTVIDHSPVVLFALDRSGVIRFSGGQGLTRLGLGPGERVGRSVRDLLQRDAPHAMSFFERGLGGEEVTWVGSLGEATFECRLTPVRDARGVLTGVIGLAIDVTERLQGEEQRLALERRLLEAQKLESLGLMAGGIAHDFNNLLVTVLGNASLALADLLPGAAGRQAVARIESAAIRASELTRQLLAFAGKEELATEAVDVNAIIRETQELLEVSLSSRVTVGLELEPSLPPIEGDATQLRQVVMNLVLNAADAMGDADGLITVRTGIAVLDQAALDEAWHDPDASPGPHQCIEVADNGCGMDASTLARIFDPFFSTKPTGRGLGLANVLGIVFGHRGAVHVSSEPGRGTTFRVFLPAEARRAASRPAPSEAASGRTVLLVDDEEDVRATTAHMLERLGCDVLLAGDGQEGLRMFSTHAGTIDAVLMDLSLPRMSGDRAAQEIHRLRPDARVILMSGHADERVRTRMSGDDSAGFLRKPFSVTDLEHMIDKVLAERRRAS